MAIKETAVTSSASSRRTSGPPSRRQRPPPPGRGPERNAESRKGPAHSGEHAVLPMRIGRYEVDRRIAQGGMATVHLGRQHGDFGFSRVVAIKRLLPQFSADPTFRSMFIDEAGLAARIRHPNVVSTLDVVSADGELLLVMDYVNGESLYKLLRAAAKTNAPVPLEVVSTVICDVLQGLHSAHSAKDRHGRALGLVHRDVSPQNVLVGVDGVARVLDFGIAKAATSVQPAEPGGLRGKAGYMAPEQARAGQESRQSDLFAAGIVLWELLTLKRLFSSELQTAIEQRKMGHITLPSRFNANVPPALDAVVLKALALQPSARFVDAQEMATAVERACPSGPRSIVARWVNGHAAQQLAERDRLMAELETRGGSELPPAPQLCVVAESQASAPAAPSPPARETVAPGTRRQPPRPDPSITAPERTLPSAVEAPADDDVMPRTASLPPLGIVDPIARSGTVLRAAPAKQPPPHRRRALALLVTLTLIGAAVTLIWGYQAGPSEPEPGSVARQPSAPDRQAAQPVPEPVVSKPVVAVAPPAPSAAVPSAPKSSAPSVVPVEASSITQVTASPPRKTPPSLTSRKLTRHKAKPLRQRRSHCSPPYRIDRAGRRHYKAECFQ